MAYASAAPGGTGATAAGRPRSHRVGSSRHRARDGRPQTTKRVLVGAGVLALLAGGVLGGMHFFQDTDDSTVSTEAGAPAKVKQLDAQAPRPAAHRPLAVREAQRIAVGEPLRERLPLAEELRDRGLPEALHRRARDRGGARHPCPARPPSPRPSGGRRPGGSAGRRPGQRRARQGRLLAGDAQRQAERRGPGPVRRHGGPQLLRPHQPRRRSAPGERITAAGYQWSTYGENIAYGQPDPTSVMDSWMHSDGHRKNILNCSFKEIGVGINNAPGGPRWTQVFGAR
ncbi:hypothetical protein GCM10020000_52100 [Streptomyces olivoverticillatus]